MKYAFSKVVVLARNVLFAARPETEQFRALICQAIAAGLCDEEICEVVSEKVSEFVAKGSPAAAQLQQIMQATQ